MDVIEVDERDSGWEDDGPRFRVHLWTTPGHACWTYDITGADVLEVVRWAQVQAGDDRLYGIALVVDALRTTGDVERGLVWLLGMDANDPSDTDDASRRRAGMHARRGRRIVADG